MGDKVYSHANGIEGHRERLLSYFPLRRKAIDMPISNRFESLEQHQCSESSGFQEPHGG